MVTLLATALFKIGNLLKTRTIVCSSLIFTLKCILIQCIYIYTHTHTYILYFFSPKKETLWTSFSLFNAPLLNKVFSSLLYSCQGILSVFRELLVVSMANYRVYDILVSM